MPTDTTGETDPTVAARDRDRAVLAAVVFVVLFAQVTLYPGVDTLVTALGATGVVGASTWFLAVEFVAFVVFAGVWGLASDATGRRVALVRLGALGAGLGYVTLAVAPQVAPTSFGTVLAVRTFQGAATVGAFSLAITMLMDLSGGHGRNMGAAGIAIGLGTALGAPVGGLLYGFGPFVPLAVAGALMFAVALAVGVLDDRTGGPSRRGGFADVRSRLRSTPALLVPYTFGFVDRLSAGVFALAGTLYFRTVLGLSPAETGAMLLAFFGPFALLQYPFGVLSDRLGRAVPIVVGSAGYGVAVIAVGLAPTVALVAAAMVLVGVVGAFMAPATMALVTDLAGADDRGVAMAGFNAAGSLGFLGGVVLGGTVAEATGFTAVFLVTGAIEIAVALVAVPALLWATPAGRQLLER